MLSQTLRSWLVVWLLSAAILQSTRAQPTPGAAVLLSPTPTATAGATAGAAACILNITGLGNRPGIQSAQLSCTGGTITAAAHKALRDFWGAEKILPGVVWGGEGCIGYQGCLLTLCDASNAVFKSATVTALQGAGKPEPEWQLAVCIRGQSTVTFQDSSFTLNKDATPLAVFDNGTTLLLETCTIQGNAFTTDLGGDGWSGGVAVQHARLTVLSSNITGNTGSGWAAGAVFVRGIAQAKIYDTRLTNNNARQGPAVFAEGDTTTVIQGCRFEGNSASSRGGAVFANQWANVQILPSKPGEAAFETATVFCFLCSGGWLLPQQWQPLSL